MTTQIITLLAVFTLIDITLAEGKVKPEDKQGYDKTKDLGVKSPKGADVPFDGTQKSIADNWQMWPKADMKITWSLVDSPTGDGGEGDADERAAGVRAENRDSGQKHCESTAVSDPPQLRVGLKERANQEHARAGRADEARDRSPDRQKRCIGARMGREVTLQGYAATDYIKRE